MIVPGRLPYVDWRLAMRWFWQASDRRRFPRFKADVPEIAGLIGDRDIISLRTRCESISEGGVGTPGLESLGLGDVTLELHLPSQQIPSGLIPSFATAARPDAALSFGPLQPKEKTRRWLG